MKPQTGYSGTPLAKKLGINAGAGVLLENAPEAYARWLAPLPPGVEFQSRLTPETDLVHLFTDQLRVLEASLLRLRPAVRPDVAVWVSWPKKASKRPTDITEDRIRDVALPMGWVDIKVCAVDEVWSGLKLVIRKELRGHSEAGR